MVSSVSALRWVGLFEGGCRCAISQGVALDVVGLAQSESCNPIPCKSSLLVALFLVCRYVEGASWQAVKWITRSEGDLKVDRRSMTIATLCMCMYCTSWIQSSDRCCSCDHTRAFSSQRSRRGSAHAYRSSFSHSLRCMACLPQRTPCALDSVLYDRTRWRSASFYVRTSIKPSATGDIVIHEGPGLDVSAGCSCNATR